MDPSPPFTFITATLSFRSGYSWITDPSCIFDISRYFIPSHSSCLRRLSTLWLLWEQLDTVIWMKRLIDGGVRALGNSPELNGQIWENKFMMFEAGYRLRNRGWLNDLFVREQCQDSDVSWASDLVLRTRLDGSTSRAERHDLSFRPRWVVCEEFDCSILGNRIGNGMVELILKCSSHIASLALLKGGHWLML